ncbi:MAG TPA: uroporphyrinogen-III synthase [Polyangiaceae bacterium]
MPDTALPVVALLETRMGRELARLVEKHGGRPLSVAAVRECPELPPETVHCLINDLQSGRYEIVVFMTGVAVSLLFETAEQLGRRPELVAALRPLTTVCRGPKPTAALRGFGIPPTLTARDSFTTAELIDALTTIELRGRRLLLFHYGERSETLSETLLARGVDLEEVWLYRWSMPEDTQGLEQLVQSLIQGRVDALAITCQIQFRHLYQISERLGLSRQLVTSLNERVVVAAVGPTCQAMLQAHGVRVQIMPDHPKMGPMVATLMRHLHLPAHHHEGMDPETPLAIPEGIADSGH